MRQLDVYLGENLIGHVVENRKGGRFEYEQAVVDKLAGRPVLSMAFSAKGRPFGEAKTSAWFNGLLPEGSRRDEICRSLGVSPYDWIGLLAEIGWECAGAVIDCTLRNLEEGIRSASIAYPGAAARHEAKALGRVCRLKRDSCP